VIGLAVGLPFGWAVAVTAAYPGSARGVLLFIVDHSWSLLNTVTGAVFLALNLLFGNRVDRVQSRHSGCLFLTKGVFGGFATTLGTVQAGTTVNIRCHEDVHVLQARVFGPFYLPLVMAHYVVVTVVPYWLLYHDRAHRPINSLGTYFLRGVYPNVWCEKWAYSVEGSPP
jgi:hypothetical protein